MTWESITTISASLCALLITLILLGGALPGGNIKEKVYRWFFAWLLFNLAGTCCELTTAILSGTLGKTASLLIKSVDFANYTLGSFVFISFAMYLYAYLSIQTRISKQPFRFVVCFCVANILLLAALQFTPLFALPGASVHSTKAIWVTQIFPFLSVITLFLGTFRQLKQLKPRVWFSMLLYMLIQLVCYTVENAFPGVWVSYLGSAVAAFIMYINIQVELMQQMKAQQAELAESRIAIMLSQIQPHFLYNSLTAVAKLCDVDPTKAKTAVTDFAHYLRGNLESLEKRKVVFFDDELDHVEAYLAMEQLRFGDKLAVEYDIPVRDFILPPLTVQPLAENAVQHGLMEKDSGGMLRIRTQMAHRAVRVIISDDGVGFDPSAKMEEGRTHVGIENVRRRLEALCRGTLEIQSTPGMGTTAIITIPYNSEEEST